MRPNVDFRECLKDSPKFRASLEDAEQDLDLLEGKLEKLMKLCSSMVDAGKVYSNANRPTDIYIAPLQGYYSEALPTLARLKRRVLSLFVLGLRDVALHFQDDQLATGKNPVSDALSRFTQVLTELQKYHSILLDQAHRSIVQSLGNFIKRDIRKVKETRKHFEKISNDLDTALVKNSQASRNKPHECEEVNNIVLATRSGFLHTALDYVFQVNVLHSKKNFDILDTVLAYLHAQNAFFHQGSDLFSDLEPYMKQVAAQVETLSSTAERERKEMENRHLLVQQKIKVNLSKAGKQSVLSQLRAFNDVQVCDESGSNGDQDTAQQLLTSSSDSEDDVKMEGYLFKRTSNTFKTWVRRWFQIHNNQLVYRKRSKDSITIMEDDLRLCTVRPSFDLDRRFCFEVVSPARSHILQADSDSDCTRWILAIQEGVSKAYNNRRSQGDTGDVSESYDDSKATMENAEMASKASSDSLASLLKSSNLKPSSISRVQSTLLQVPGNNVCCDCGAPSPSWASINLGITLCIECSGIHRSLGVHISKVRSINLDAWELDLVKVMAELGNTVVNQIYEANVDETLAARPNASSNRTVREAWIKSKYVFKSFTKQIPRPDSHSKPNARRWSVCKRKKKLPSGKVNQKSSLPQAGDPDESTTTDVFVFGSAVNNDERWKQISIHLDDSEHDSGSDVERDPEVASTTSLEDISKLHPDMLLYKAARARNLPVMLEAISLGANPNWKNEEEEGRTALIQAVHSGSMTTVEFLLLNGAKVDIGDDHRQGPLHHATILGHTGQVCQILKRNVNHQTTDENGKDPLMIAMDKANADIVTLLRLARLNEEMKEAEGFTIQGDETVNEVFRDFTNMANSAPERLNRNK